MIEHTRSVQSEYPPPHPPQQSVKNRLDQHSVRLSVSRQT